MQASTDPELRKQAARIHASAALRTDSLIRRVVERDLGGARAADPDEADTRCDAIVELLDSAGDISRWAIDLGADGLIPATETVTLVDPDGHAFIRAHLAFHEVLDEDTRTALTGNLKTLIAQAITGGAAPDPGRLQAVEALVTRAREKGVTQIDTILLAEVLGLDEADGAPYVSRTLPARDAVCARPDCGHVGADHHHGDTKCWAHLPRTGDGYGVMSPVTICECAGFLAADDSSQTAAPAPVDPHNFDAEHLSEAVAKRRMPNCKECGGPATAAAHDGDQSPETLHLRALLTA